MKPQASWTELRGVMHAAEEVASCSDPVGGGLTEETEPQEAGDMHSRWQEAPPGGPLSMLRDLQKVAVMGIRTKRVACTALSAGLRGQSSGRAPGQTNSKVASARGFPPCSQIWGNHRLLSPGASRKPPPPGGGQGGRGSQGLLTQLRRTATCQDNPPTSTTTTAANWTCVPSPGKAPSLPPALRQANRLCCPFKRA